MEKGFSGQTASETKNSNEVVGEKLEFRDHDTMPVLAIPDVAVQEPVDVDVEVTTIDVHVRNEDLCDKPSIPPPLEKYLKVVFHFGLRSPPVYHTNYYFLFL